MRRRDSGAPTRRGALRGLVAVTVLAATALTGCSGPDTAQLSSEGKALSIEQSELLAQARFRLSTVEAFTAHVEAGNPEDTTFYAADLTVDTTHHQAWGTLHRGPAKLAVDEPVMLDGTRVATLSGGTWRVDSPQGSGYAALPIVLSLVADRPENAQLLRQSAARYLGEGEANGGTAQVYRLATAEGSEGHTRLWLTDDGQVTRLDDGGGSDGPALIIDVTSEDPQPRPDVLEQVLPPAQKQNQKQATP